MVDAVRTSSVDLVQTLRLGAIVFEGSFPPKINEKEKYHYLWK
jgi:hypothetical protein